jgi:hypothetical protein
VIVITPLPKPFQPCAIGVPRPTNDRKLQRLNRGCERQYDKLRLGDEEMDVLGIPT